MFNEQIAGDCPIKNVSQHGNTIPLGGIRNQGFLVACFQIPSGVRWLKKFLDDCDISSIPAQQSRQTENHSGQQLTEYKLYSCPYCGRSFSQKTNMRRHVKIHTGEKDCKCKVCGKEFRLKQHLKGHMLTHMK
ncbi:zinc finger protein 12-like [Ruditapes philippinarum]|uniref:zinc finger protein 12-like n=1 Tax=Ruditapes philippinarum TaxID=129788 RepID=UPI00295B5E3E|nr:zinc finger protein 12-like [Ruditapes philippinarum]